MVSVQAQSTLYKKQTKKQITFNGLIGLIEHFYISTAHMGGAKMNNPYPQAFIDTLRSVTGATIT